MDLKVSEKEFKELTWKADTLVYMENFMKNLTEAQRNHFTAGELADVLLKLIKNTRRQME